MCMINIICGSYQFDGNCLVTASTQLAKLAKLPIAESQE